MKQNNHMQYKQPTHNQITGFYQAFAAWKQSNPNVPCNASFKVSYELNQILFHLWSLFVTNFIPYQQRNSLEIADDISLIRKCMNQQQINRVYYYFCQAKKQENSSFPTQPNVSNSSPTKDLYQIHAIFQIIHLITWTMLILKIRWIVIMRVWLIMNFRWIWWNRFGFVTASGQRSWSWLWSRCWFRSRSWFALIARSFSSLMMRCASILRWIRHKSAISLCTWYQTICIIVSAICSSHRMWRHDTNKKSNQYEAFTAQETLFLQVCFECKKSFQLNYAQLLWADVSYSELGQIVIIITRCVIQQNYLNINWCRIKRRIASMTFKLCVMINTILLLLQHKYQRLKFQGLNPQNKKILGFFLFRFPHNPEWIPLIFESILYEICSKYTNFQLKGIINKNTIIENIISLQLKEWNINKLKRVGSSRAL